MIIKQFEDKYLSHYSYAILSGNQVVVIDPARNVSPYIEFVQSHDAELIGVIETHPHADFVSGHLELYHKTGATIYCSKLNEAQYAHQYFDDSAQLVFGDVILTAINTPGHSHDSISILLTCEGRDHAVFTGDTLFIGDCGRPDLREDQNISSKREELAKSMYHSLRHKLLTLKNEVIVFPAHGAGSLCGKALSEANLSTIGAERISNWSLQEMTEQEFITKLIADQPFIPRYFSYNVQLNKTGAPATDESLKRIIIHDQVDDVLLSEIKTSGNTIIDTRASDQFKQSHLLNSINLMDSTKFETWLGSIINPFEKFYLIAADHETLKRLIKRAASIGYEPFIKGAFVFTKGDIQSDKLDQDHFEYHPDDYTIIDIRNRSESKETPIFKHAINIPLPELRENMSLIPGEKPIVVHCAGGYRSAAGSSIIKNEMLHLKVLDLGERIKDFV